MVATSSLAASVIACQLVSTSFRAEPSSTPIPSEATTTSDRLAQVIGIFEQAGFSVSDEPTCSETGDCYLPAGHPAGMFGGINLSANGGYVGFGLVIHKAGVAEEQAQVVQQLLVALDYVRVAEWVRTTSEEYSGTPTRGADFTFSPTIGVNAYLSFDEYEEGPFLVVEDTR